MKIVYRKITKKEEVDIAIKLITEGFNVKDNYFKPIKKVLINQKYLKGVLLKINTNYVGAIILIHQSRYFKLHKKEVYNICNWYVEQKYRYLAINLIMKAINFCKNNIIVNYTPNKTSKIIFEKLGFNFMNKDSVFFFNYKRILYKLPVFKFYEVNNKNKKNINHLTHLNKKNYFIIEIFDEKKELIINYKLQNIELLPFLKISMIKFFYISDERLFIKNKSFLSSLLYSKHKCLLSNFDCSYNLSHIFFFRKKISYMIKNNENLYISPIGSEMSYIL